MFGYIKRLKSQLVDDIRAAALQDSYTAEMGVQYLANVVDRQNKMIEELSERVNRLEHGGDYHERQKE